METRWGCVWIQEVARAVLERRRPGVIFREESPLFSEVFPWMNYSTGIQYRLIQYWVVRMKVVARSWRINYMYCTTMWSFIIVGPDRIDKLLTSVIEARKTGQGHCREEDVMQNRI